jgi:dephospho-CoA kinase
VTRPYLLGLTGSVGMGKSTTAGLFAEAGVPVWDADATVHTIYDSGGGGAAALLDLVPEAIAGDAVDRDRLRHMVANDPTLLSRIEAQIHPLVAADRAAFIARHRAADLLLFDIPLLYETGAETWLDGVLVVTAPADVQRARVLSRPGMTDAMLAVVLARQLSDAEKCARADFIISTDAGIEAARAAVLSLRHRITSGRRHA